MFEAKNYFRVVVRLMETKVHDESYTIGIVNLTSMPFIHLIDKSVPYERKGD